MKQTTVIFIAAFLGVGVLAGCAWLATADEQRTETLQITPMEIPGYIPKGFHRCAPMDYQSCWYVL